MASTTAAATLVLGATLLSTSTAFVSVAPGTLASRSDVSSFRGQAPVLGTQHISRVPSSRENVLRCSATATEFDVKAYLAEKKVAVDEALDKAVVSTIPETDFLCDVMRYSLLAGGKRIRPILTIAACEMFGGSMETAMPCAVSTEMIHTMSLMHDDLPAMDNDDLRRGMPTSHVKFGEDMAILGGDALLSKSFEHTAKHTTGVEPARVVAVLSRLGSSVGELGLAGGQVADLQNEGKSGVTLDTLRFIHRHKTAALLKVACCGGALLAGASDEDVKNMEFFSDTIGLAFQVADDILDCTQTSEQLGKTAGKDIAQDKTTYPKLLGMDGAKQEAKRLIDEAYKALEPYGDKAVPLRALADYIIQREN